MVSRVGNRFFFPAGTGCSSSSDRFSSFVLLRRVTIFKKNKKIVKNDKEFRMIFQCFKLIKKITVRKICVRKWMEIISTLPESLSLKNLVIMILRK